MAVSEEAKDEATDYRQKYRNLKRKFKLLIYENECFQEELRKAQRKLLKVSRDKSFLLDRLLQYETVESSSSESDATISSDSEAENKKETTMPIKKKKPLTGDQSSTCVNSGTPVKKKKISRKSQLPKPPNAPMATTMSTISTSSSAITPPATSTPTPTAIAEVQEPSPISHGDGHLTAEEIERHLEARQPLRDLMPEKAPLTVPMEMFSSEPSGLESELAEGLGGESSPSNVEGVPDDDGLVIDLPE